jgi:hypothetical protein
MLKELNKESEEAFNQICLHRMAFGEKTNWDYFKLSPVRYIIYHTFTKLILSIQKYIISTKGATYLLIVKKVVLNNFKYPNTTDLHLKRMYMLSVYFKETIMWMFVFKKMLKYRNKYAH